VGTKGPSLSCHLLSGFWPDQSLRGSDREVISERLGNAKNGVKGIKRHRWFLNFDWQQLAQKSLEPPHRPNLDGNDFRSVPRGHVACVCIAILQRPGMLVCACECRYFETNQAPQEPEAVGRCSFDQEF
jgi:hypothetical protein